MPRRDLRKVHLVRPPASGTVLDLVIEAIRVCFRKNGLNIRDLEKVKQKYGICTMGITCLEKAVEGPQGGLRGCPHHHAAAKAGIRLAKWKAYDSEYGKFRKLEMEKEKKAKQEAEEYEAARVKRNDKAAKSIRGKRAA